MLIELHQRALNVRQDFKKKVYKMKKKVKLNTLFFKTFFVLTCLILAMLYNHLKGA